MLDAIILWGFAGPAILIAVGMVILIGGGETLVRNASRLAVAMKIPPVIVGLTVVAFGTSAPELAVSLSAVLQGSADLAVGNVVGSNICNIGLIFGAAALLSPVTISSTLIRREIPLMIVLTFGVYFLSLPDTNILPTAQAVFSSGRIFPWGGGILVALLFAYIGWTLHELSRKKERNGVYAREIEENVLTDAEPADHQTNSWQNIVICLFFIIVGIILLVAGSNLMVLGSVQIARMLGVSELFIGLTILAVGTSLPELIVTILAAFQGKSDIASGNVIGSNIFNILGVLGATALFSGGTDSGCLLVPIKAIQFDMPVMIFMSLCCMVFCITNRRVSRYEGLFLLFCYVAYIVALCWSAIG